MNECISPKTRKLRAYIGKRERREKVNTKIVRTPGWMSYMRERVNTKIVRTPGWMSYMRERVNTKIVRTPGWMSYRRERENEQLNGAKKRCR
jgi:hypothetical protein